MTDKIFQINSIDDYSELFNELKLLINEHSVIFLIGEMGSGKTTFTKLFLKFLGVEENVSSPTFSIVNEYKNTNKQPFFHFDLYRLKNERELDEIGFQDYINSGSLCLIEWPEFAFNKIKSRIELYIEAKENEKRIITLRVVTQ